MSNTRLIAVCLAVLLIICFVSSERSLSRPTRPDGSKMGVSKSYINKLVHHLDSIVGPRYGKRFSAPPVRKMQQEIYPDESQDFYEPYKIYENLF
ncbi:hypothetical protein QE152_g31224 [Popillia japonica]|uniref:Uncharacterized protein n=1 Tax=Popillia japonica TaxID=7064 RepID=A0AAW1JD14_POPJA